MDLQALLNVVIGFLVGNWVVILVWIIIAYLFAVSKTQEATQIVEEYVADMADGVLSGAEKKKLAIMAIDATKIFSFLPAVVWQTLIGWLIDRVIANVNKNAAAVDVSILAKSILASKGGWLKK